MSKLQVKAHDKKDDTYYFAALWVRTMVDYNREDRDRRKFPTFQWV